MTITKNIDGITYEINNDYDNSGNFFISKIEGNTKSIVLPVSIDGKNIAGILSSVLRGNKDIENITIPKSYIHLHTSCFERAIGLKNVVFEKGSKIISIPPRAFLDCINLKNIKLPGTTETINSFAFAGCKSLKSFVSPIELKRIQLCAFKFSGIESFHVNEFLKTFPCSVIEGTPCSKITVEPTNKNFYSKDGVLFSSLNELLLYPPGKINAKYVVPNNITSIKTHSIQANDFLKDLIISDSVKKIEYNAILNTNNLKSITIRSQNTQLERWALSGIPINTRIKCPKNYNFMDEIKNQGLQICTTDRLTSFINDLSAEETKTQK